MLSIFIDILDKIPSITQDRFLACIYGGIAMGIGMGLVLKSNSSTGGTDLLTYIISPTLSENTKKWDLKIFNNLLIISHIGQIP